MQTAFEKENALANDKNVTCENDSLKCQIDKKVIDNRENILEGQFQKESNRS